MIGYATITISQDPDGQFIFPLTVWITGMRTQNLLGMGFCQKQVSEFHFELTRIEVNWTLPNQSVMAAFIKTNPIIICHKL